MSGLSSKHEKIVVNPKIYSACEFIKLIVDSVMLVWFIMEFRVLKRLLSNFIAFMQKKNKLNVDQMKKAIRRQNLFVSRWEV